MFLFYHCHQFSTELAKLTFDKPPHKQVILKGPVYSVKLLTFTKVLFSGFDWSTLSGDCRRTDSSIQLEEVVTELSRLSVPMEFIKLEVASGMPIESDSLPTPLRLDILFCIKSDEESILTPNRRWLWGSVLPS